MVETGRVQIHRSYQFVTLWFPLRLLMSKQNRLIALYVFRHEKQRIIQYLTCHVRPYICMLACLISEIIKYISVNFQICVS
jgi:hypothetical protein